MDKKKEIEAIKKKIIPILKHYRVIRAGIFGSYARGEQTKKSDVDILVELRDDIGLIEFAGLKLLLQKVLKKKIDLVEYGSIRHEIKDNIIKEGISIYNG